MGFLDSAGLAHFTAWAKERFAGKQDALTPDDSVRLQDGKIGVALPVKPVTRAEYDALTEEEKQADRVYLVESSVSDAPGFGGFVPPGAIIPFMGLRAPLGYLVCDGAEYEAAAYPALAEYFREQFGAANYFGGDGTATFAVPDMRNLFLRGYRGEADERLSGAIGEKQVATAFPRTKCDNVNGNFAMYGNQIDDPTHVDSSIGDPASVKFVTMPGRNESDAMLPYYTSRPVNMAVLYCIKA